MDVHGQQRVSMNTTQPTMVGGDRPERQKDDALWTIEDVAGFLNVSRQTVRRRMKAGVLPHIRNGRIIRFVPSDIREWVERQEAA